MGKRPAVVRESEIRLTHGQFLVLQQEVTNYSRNSCLLHKIAERNKLLHEPPRTTCGSKQTKYHSHVDR